MPSARLLPPLLCLMAALRLAPALAQDAPTTPPPDKSGYNLFNPVPDALLRDFSTDRPGKTQSPVTLDAGRYQIESDLYNYTYDAYSQDGTTTRLSTYGVPNLKIGLLDAVEFDAILPIYNVYSQRDRATGDVTRIHGLGDLQLGGKVNIFGNAGGDSSFGLLGFVKIPTAARGLGNNMVEGSLYIPYQTNLPAGFQITAEPVISLLREHDKQGYAGDYQFLVNLNHPVWGKTVVAALELALDYSSDHNTGTRDTIDPSIQWLVTRTLQLDAGAYIGITKAAPDFNPYVGFAYRF